LQLTHQAARINNASYFHKTLFFFLASLPTSFAEFAGRRVCLKMEYHSLVQHASLTTWRWSIPSSSPSPQQWNWKQCLARMHPSFSALHDQVIVLIVFRVAMIPNFLGARLSVGKYTYTRASAQSYPCDVVVPVPGSIPNPALCMLRFTVISKRKEIFVGPTRRNCELN